MTSRGTIYLSSPHMSGLEQRYIAEAFATNWIAPLGKNVDSFELELSAYVGSKGAVAVSSGTAALHLALVLSGVEKDDIVFCSSFTFVASANPILYQKAIPVFIDSEPYSWNMSPEALEQAFKRYAAQGKRPKAVIVVNLYGQSANYKRLKEICDFYEVAVIEDAAESLGASYGQKMSGTVGKFGIFSFNGNKIITTSGGGMLVSDDVELLAKARFLATQARDQAKYYQHSEAGYNYRLSNVLAGIGRGQLKVIHDRIDQKRQIFNKYVEGLSLQPEIQFLQEASWGRSNRWLTTIMLESGKPEDMIDYLGKFAIESRHVWKPLHLQPLFKEMEYFKHDVGWDVSGELFDKGVCLPSGTNMTVEEQQEVIEHILTFLSINA